MIEAQAPSAAEPGPATTRAALRELEAFSSAMLRPASPWPVPQCVRAASAPPEASRPEVLPTDVLERLRADVQRACDAGGAASLPLGLLRRVPLLLWNGGSPAASIPGLLDRFVAVTMARGIPRRRWLVTLIEAWLRDFALAAPRHAEAGRMIARMLRHCDDYPALLLWRHAEERYALFDPVVGPERMAGAMLDPHAQSGAVLRHTGMDDPLRAAGNFFRASIAAMLAGLPGALHGRAAAVVWERAAGLLEETRFATSLEVQGLERTALRFPEMAGAVARAALDPWLAPRPGLAAPREAIKAFLIRNLGDPRLSLSLRHWAGAGEAAIGLVRSWLAAESLELFLALISTASEDEQWPARQAFWRACLRRIPNAEVWVVFGAALANRPEAARDLRGAFGHLESPTSQAVLLIRLGSLVLSEWSRTGTLRAWRIGDPDCPRLYEQRYTKTVLFSRSLEFPDHPSLRTNGTTNGGGLWHHGSRQGLWQGCAAAFLRDHLGLELTEADYMGWGEVCVG